MTKGLREPQSLDFHDPQSQTNPRDRVDSDCSESETGSCNRLGLGRIVSVGSEMSETESKKRTYSESTQSSDTESKEMSSDDGQETDRTVRQRHVPASTEGSLGMTTKGEVSLMAGEEGEDEEVENVQGDVEAQGAEAPARLSWYKRFIGLGLILTVVKVVLKVLGDVIVKRMKHVDPIVLLHYRSITMMTMCLPASIALNKPPFPQDRTLKARLLLVTRGLIEGVAAMAFFFSLQHMPIGDQKMVTTSRPIITIISARIFLKEAIGKAEILATMLMTAGVILVIKPDFIFGEIIKTEDFVERDNQYMLAACLLLGSTILTANGTIIVRMLRKENFMSMMFSREIQYSALTYAVIQFAGLAYMILSPIDRLQVFAISAVQVMIQLLNLASLKLEEANKITIVERSSGIIVAMLVQIFIFDDLPDMITSIGVALGSCAVVTIGIKKICLKKKLKGAGKNGKVAATSADTATIDAVTNATNAAIVPPVN